MDGKPNLQHLPLPQTITGDAKLGGGPRPRPAQEKHNRQNRQAHSASIVRSTEAGVAYWKNRQDTRLAEQLPPIPADIPFLLRLEPGIDLDFLTTAFDLEVVAEDEDGTIFVSTEDVDATQLISRAQEFIQAARGSAGIGKLYEVLGPDNTDERLDRILSPSLREYWPDIQTDQDYYCDVSIESIGTIRVPEMPGKRDGESDDRYDARIERWQERVREKYNEIDELQHRRQVAFDELVKGYEGEVISIFEEEPTSASFPDSFTCRIRIPGQGLRDIALNHPHVFEISEPEDTELPFSPGAQNPAEDYGVALLPPDVGAPRIGVIDSGIQEEHPLLNPAVDLALSFSYVPGSPNNDTADYVAPGGHGTRVAGAVIFGEKVTNIGEYQPPAWVVNIRVLDTNNSLDTTLLPAALLQSITEKFCTGDNPVRIFNHSINASAPCKTGRMSSWAAAIDQLSWSHDLLVIQSTGNLPEASHNPTQPGLLEHYNNDNPYPDYLSLASSRIANPAQSLSALCVGSVSYDQIAVDDLISIAPTHAVSSFSRSGPGIWNSIKPDVVEFGGDLATVDGNAFVRLTDACPELVRSTLHQPSPLADRDDVGTSYSAPKVSHMAARIAQEVNDASSSLIRSIIGCSAQWPPNVDVANEGLFALRTLGYGIPDVDRCLHSSENRACLITSDDLEILPGEAQVFSVPIPEALRSPASEFPVRIDISMAYTAPVRRSRRLRRQYLATWLDWEVSKKNESEPSFLSRALKDSDPTLEETHEILPWHLRDRDNRGLVTGASRSSGTLQKDWAIFPAFELPETLCIAVRGHKGWDRSGTVSARYALCVSIEALDADVNVYEQIEAQVQPMVEVEIS